MAQKIEIYRKSQATPIRLEVESVQERTTGSPPAHQTFKTESGAEGKIYLNKAEIEAVVITPVE